MFLCIRIANEGKVETTGCSCYIAITLYNFRYTVRVYSVRETSTDSEPAIKVKLEWGRVLLRLPLSIFDNAHGHFARGQKAIPHGGVATCSALFLLNMWMFIVHTYMLPTITCLSIFKIINLSHRYALSYVNILKNHPDTYYMGSLIMTKVTVYN